MNRFAHSTALAAFCASLVVSIAGCGKPDKPAAPAAAARAAPTSASAEQGASAQEVAQQARAGVSCPAKVKSASPRAADAPVDDVLGVRPGLGYEEAVNVVLCTQELLVATDEKGRGFDLKVPQPQVVRQGFSARMAEPRVVRTGKQIVQEMQRDAMARGANAVREDLKPGQTKWFVATMGVPGQESVLSVAREERFGADQAQTIDNVTAALLKKYGTPTRVQHAAATQLPLLRWAHDLAGRLVTETSPLYGKCMGTTDPNGSVNLSPDCGIVVQAMLIPQKANPELVDRMQVGVVDQAGGFRMIAETERALGQQDAQRRAQEVAKANKNAKGPSL
ncbi:MAG: hypothetical protein ABI218_12720 [Caldimonas sp.]